MKRSWWCPALAALTVALACNSAQPSVPLEPRWRPLRDVVQHPSTSSDVDAAAHCPHVYVHRLDVFLAKFPLGSPVRESVLAHEQVHAVRQEAVGEAWYDLYNSDPAYRWREESLAYRAQFEVLIRAGLIVPIEPYAEGLSGPIYRNMIGLEAARTWVRAQVAELSQPR